MKKIIVVLFVLLPYFAFSQSVEGYKLVWGDEFNIDGLLDTAKWRFEQGFVRNREPQWYQADNAYCKDGVLRIIARKEKVKNPDYEQGSKDWKKSTEYAEFTSSSVHTKGAHSWKYGRFEVCARIPVGAGAWPAIWFVGVEKDWPYKGEIDVMEFYGTDKGPSILANTAWGGERRGGAKWNTQIYPFTHFVEKDKDWAAKFHVWRMDWTEDYIRIYLDDELLNETDLSKTFNPDGFNPFRQPQQILLNLALRSKDSDFPDSLFPMVCEIDYVRIYQKE